MGRLIDADKLKQHYAWWEIGDGEITYAEAKKLFDTIIDVQPTVDAEPVRHGRWIYKEYRTTKDDVIGFYLCSECGHANWIKEDNYCSLCGAKMDGEKREDG